MNNFWDDLDLNQNQGRIVDWKGRLHLPVYLTILPWRYRYIRPNFFREYRT